ncbi:MAG: 50S ribosomal protein L10 [Candidatus Yanofskybacteria bacterium RIFCSPHIGHO2_02_FULL_50_12]|uniref:Large ribosomal subunit protein uL10 n=1 Tax=Candidatus Yanofskybacteria bacterium RIFCSPHIGHO2_02_FULL_50_12 TaxID=1802685 RepID=A0A1F8FWH9_9BACT|nr:MAG: 50S ribosomal protein L10 [Candidatus Yanofskybacteria bacterium RIFCSPHIGHO2_02_FULL_50_12]
MKSKSAKKDELKALASKLPDSKITIFTSFARAGEKGLSVAQMTELKRALRDAHSEYVVTKKTLIDRAIPDNGVDVYGMQGSLGLVIGNDEPYGLAKKVYDFAKKNPALQFFGALLDGGFITKEQFLEMAKMPSREILLGRLVGMLTYPMRGLAVVLSEIEKKKLSN